jgi:hypothetical protein
LTRKPDPAELDKYEPEEGILLRRPVVRSIKKKRPILAVSSTHKAASSGENFRLGRLLQRLGTRSSSDPDADAGKHREPSFAQKIDLSKWYTVPALTAGAVAGGVGGFKLVNWLGKKRRKAELEGNEQDARSEYEAALRGLYQPKSASTVSSIIPSQKTTPVGIDALYDRLEKTGFVGATLAALPGLYATYALGTGLPAAYLGYKTEAGRQEKILREAVKRRAALRALESPPEVILRTEPLKKKKKKDEEEDDLKNSDR